MPTGTPFALQLPKPGHALPWGTLVLALLLSLQACSGGGSAQSGAPPDITNQLAPGAGLEAIAAHLVNARQKHAVTRALALHHPDLSRADAYRIQMMTLDTEEQAGHTVAGWKMGGTRVTDPEAAPDPQFGYSLDSNVYPAGEPFPLDRLTEQHPMVEAEIAVWIGRDLPGPDITREEFLESVASVSGGVEIISSRLRPTDPAHPESITTAHAIADDISHGAAILGTQHLAPDALDLNREVAWIEINGEEQARGISEAIMGTEGNPLDAVLWLARELPRHGQYLRKGQFVITGSLYDNPTMAAGDHAVVHYSSLGTIEFSMAGTPR